MNICDNSSACRVVSWLSSGLFAGLFLLCAGAVEAQSKDYSKGFAKFYELGLPKAQNAVYVRLNTYGQPYFPGRGTQYFGRLQLSGNAWLLKEDKQGKSLFIVGNCRLVEVYDNKALTAERKKKMEEALKKHKGKPSALRAFRLKQRADDRLGGVWKKADLKKDIAKVKAFLKKMLKKTGDAMSSYYFNDYGSLLLAASQFHAQGHAKEANEIVDAIFTLTKKPRKVILLGLDQLADTQYQAAHKRFTKEGDWKKFHAELAELLSRFPSGWRTGMAVKMLAVQVKTRAQQAEIPAIAGPGLSKADQALALELARKSGYTGGGRSYDRGLWLLAAPAPAAKGSAEPVEVHPLDRIKKGGMKSVPLLLALLKDNCLSRTGWQQLEGSSFYGMTSYSRAVYRYRGEDEDELTEEKVKQLYDSLARPASRGEIARHLLRAVLLGRESDRFNRAPEDVDELRENCREWYEGHKDKSMAELARLYLEEGNSEQQSAGLQCLLRVGKDPDMEFVEKYFLGAENVNQHLYEIQQYLQARGEKAKPFADKYRARLKKQIAGSKSAMFRSDERSKASLKRALASLENILSPKPLAGTIEAILSGKKKLESSYELLQQGLAREKRDKALSLILDSALKAKELKLRTELLSLVTWVPRVQRGGRFVPGQMPSPEKSEEAALKIKTHAAQWKQLLADKRLIEHPYSSGKMSLGDSAAFSIETVYGEQGRSFAYRTYSSLGKRMLGLMRSRAEARLAGKADKELPPFPSADKVSAEQRKKLVAKLMAAAEKDLPALAAKLKMAEHLALAEEAKDNPKLNAKALPAAHRISQVSGQTKSPETLKKFTKMGGKLLTKKMVEELLAFCQGAAKAGRIALCTISRQSCLDGIEINLKEFAPEDKEFKTQLKSRRSGRWGYSSTQERKAMVSGTVNAESLHASASWPVETPPAKAAQKPAKIPVITATDQAKEDDDEVEEDEVEAAEAELEGEWYEVEGEEDDDELEEDVEDYRGTARLEHAEKQRDEFWKKLTELLKGSGNVFQPAGIRFSGMPPAKKPKDER